MISETKPILDDKVSLEENFMRFYQWALSLEDPLAYAINTVIKENTRKHAVGFTVFYLDRSPKYTVRLHHYPEAGEIEKDIHDHAFSSRSGVLSGTLAETIYAIKKASGEAEAHYCYDDEKGIQHIVKSDESYSIQVHSVQKLRRGETFDLMPGKIHSVSVTGKTLTLMVKTTSKPFQKALVLKR